MLCFMLPPVEESWYSPTMAPFEAFCAAAFCTYFIGLLLFAAAHSNAEE